MVPMLKAGAGVHTPFLGGKYILLSELLGSRGVFSFQGIWQIDLTISLGQIFMVHVIGDVHK